MTQSLFNRRTPVRFHVKLRLFDGWKRVSLGLALSDSDMDVPVAVVLGSPHHTDKCVYVNMQENWHRVYLLTCYRRCTCPVVRYADDRWTGGTKGQGQIKKSETKGGTGIDRKGQQMTRQTDRQGDRWVVKETNVESRRSLDLCQPKSKPTDWK